MSEDYSLQPFEKNWNCGNFRLTKNGRAIIACLLWGLTTIFAVITFICLIFVDNKYSNYMYICYLTTILPSLIAFVFFFYIFTVISIN